jgi:Alpha amylase, catalytic domain
MNTGATKWWERAVVYQLYVRSFADANGDGIGDIEGIRCRLPYLADLGVDAIWLNPCYPSPQADHGYDIADYFDIDPAYGTLEEFDRMLADARALGIRIVMDVVPNHCSNQHQWFIDACNASPGSPERARFFFRDGRGVNGEEPPNSGISMCLRLSNLISTGRTRTSLTTLIECSDSGSIAASKGCELTPLSMSARPRGCLTIRGATGSASVVPVPSSPISRLVTWPGSGGVE